MTVVNRSAERGRRAGRAMARPGRTLGPSSTALLAEADLVISTTGAERADRDAGDVQTDRSGRYQRPMFILDLAVPRDFDPAIGDCLGVYLYSIDDLEEVCRAQPPAARPGAARGHGTSSRRKPARFMADLHHRATAPIIKRLREGWHQPKEDELRRLFNKLPELGRADRAAKSGQSFDRLVNKLLHPPLESLRRRSGAGPAARPARSAKAAVSVERLNSFAPPGTTTHASTARRGAATPRAGSNSCGIVTSFPTGMVDKGTRETNQTTRSARGRWIRSPRQHSRRDCLGSAIKKGKCMSSISNNTLSQDYYYQLAKSAVSPNQSGTSAADAANALTAGSSNTTNPAIDPNSPSGAISAGHHHHGGHGGGGLSQIIQTVQNALQSSSSSSTDPNQVITNALEQLFGSGDHRRRTRPARRAAPTRPPILWPASPQRRLRRQPPARPARIPTAMRRAPTRANRPTARSSRLRSCLDPTVSIRSSSVAI